MTTSPSEPVDNDQSARRDGEDDDGQHAGREPVPDSGDHDQDSEPTANAPADDNPTLPGG